MAIRTDLAVEARELYPSFEGVKELKTTKKGLKDHKDRDRDRGSGGKARQEGGKIRNGRSPAPA